LQHIERSLRGKLRPDPAGRVLSVAAVCAVLAALISGRVLANDCMGLNLIGFQLSFMDILSAVLIWLLYVGAVCLAEAGILKLFFKVGYLRCLGYAALANFVSAAIGFLWMLFPAPQAPHAGWKTALLFHQHTSILTVLLVRSFLVTVAEETVVILLLARKWAGVGLVLKAVATANVISYALSAALLLAYAYR